tara:strand:- start:2971 stop:3744 length:774 start_codon:yes stop_codon:yes gene_type:complete
MFFLDFNIFDFIDITLVSILIFQLYKLIKGSAGINIFIGMALVYIMWKIFSALEMSLISEILGQFISVGALALIIVFQQEIRRFLVLIGKNTFKNKNLFIKSKNTEKFLSTKNIEDICKACHNMSQTKTGAIIIIERNDNLDLILKTGRVISSNLSQIMIESIFYKNAPLHDGAIIIINKKIIGARCVLPISESSTIPTEMGMRHKAALGVTEQYDCIAITVSEQNGNISCFENGKIKMNLDSKTLQEIIKINLKKK